MLIQADSLIVQIKKWVVNDYFTPNIKAEVILDTLLTPYITELIQTGCKEIKEELRFITKEMSLGTEHKNNQGSKVDYILAGAQFVYLIELKTTNSSINDKQAQRYRRCCEDNKTFGQVFGKKLLDIMEDQWRWGGQKRSNRKPKPLPEKYAALPPESYTERVAALFDAFSPEGMFPSQAERAKSTLRAKKWGSTYKYLYTMGQLLDDCADNGDALWGLPLKPIYLTPDGKCPNGFSSVNLRDAMAKLKRTSPEDQYIQLLADIITDIYGG